MMPMPDSNTLHIAWIDKTKGMREYPYDINLISRTFVIRRLRMDNLANRHSPKKGKEKSTGRLFYFFNAFLLLLSIAGFIYSLAIPMGIAMAVSLRLGYVF